MNLLPPVKFWVLSLIQEAAQAEGRQMGKGMKFRLGLAL